MASERKNLPLSQRIAVLAEAGYRCAVPTCRTILAIDIHHIHQIEDGGGDELHNLIALCPTCHALHHRGTIHAEAIKSWKTMIIALNNAFDKEAMDDLIFLSKLKPDDLSITGDGVLKFSKLIAAGLASFSRIAPSGAFALRPNTGDTRQLYNVELTEKGRSFVEAWKAGDRELLQKSLIPPDSKEFRWL